MIDLPAQLPNRKRHASISITPLMKGKNGSNLLLECLMLVGYLRNLLLIVKGAARQPRELEQVRQRKLLP
jgi:hypothetical protein